MAEHPWCRDVARDESVRAAEDAVPRPAVPDWRELPERVARLEAAVFGGTESHAPAAGTEETSQSGLRTERVTLEVTHDDDDGHIQFRNWDHMLFGGQSGERFPGESVRVVPAAEAEAEIRRIARDLEETRQQLFTAMEAVHERDAALARVAELEEQAKLAPEPNGGAGSNQADAKPMAWVVVYPNGIDGLIAFREEDAADMASVGDEVVPLFRSPPPPRGWLTKEEKTAVEEAVEAFVGQAGGFAHDEDNAAVERDLASLRALLARDAPPKVRLPSERACENDNPWAGGWNALLREVRAALAAAGVEVEK